MNTKWTIFWDMHSGGGQKEDYGLIAIEAPLDKAEIIFMNRFGHNPHRVTCTCCGSDYSVDEHENLNEATAYHRNCDFGYFNKEGIEITKDEAWVTGKGLVNGATSRYIERQDPSKIKIRKECKTEPTDKWGLYMTQEEFEKSKQILVIRKEDIKKSERTGELHEQGYVWVD